MCVFCFCVCLWWVFHFWFLFLLSPPFLIKAEFATTKTDKNACSCSERNIHHTITKSSGEGECLEGLALKFEMNKSNIHHTKSNGGSEWLEGLALKYEVNENNIHHTKSNGESKWLEGLALKYEMNESNIYIFNTC